MALLACNAAQMLSKACRLTSDRAGRICLGSFILFLFVVGAIYQQGKCGSTQQGSLVVKLLTGQTGGNATEQ